MTEITKPTRPLGLQARLEQLSVAGRAYIAFVTYNENYVRWAASRAARATGNKYAVHADYTAERCEVIRTA